MAHSFTTTVTVPSKSLESVTFKVRRLSSQARANRDLKIIDHQVRGAELQERMRDLAQPYEKFDDEGQSIPGSGPPMPLEARVEYEKLNREWGAIINGVIKPATIRAGFVSGAGFDYEGHQPTADLILDNGPDSLIDEIWLAISEHAELSADEKKDSGSSGTSNGQAVPQMNSSTASAASATASGNSSGETASATSPSA